MRDYNIGDTIRCVESSSSHVRKITKGRLYKITRVNGYNTHLYVIDDNGNNMSFQIDKRFKLANNRFEGKSRG